MKIIEQEKRITDLKNPLSSPVEMTKDIINEIEDKLIEFIQCK